VRRKAASGSGGISEKRALARLFLISTRARGISELTTLAQTVARRESGVKKGGT